MDHFSQLNITEIVYFIVLSVNAYFIKDLVKSINEMRLDIVKFTVLHDRTESDVKNANIKIERIEKELVNLNLRIDRVENS